MGEDWDDFYDQLAQVRRAHLMAMLAQGATYDNDPHGTALADRLFAGDKNDDNRNAYDAQLNHHEEAGYMFGLAVGLVLGLGGAR